MIERPDYKALFDKRIKYFKLLYNNPEMTRSAFLHYQTRPVSFIEDWGVTYDPRNAGTDVPTLMPFALFQRQKELVEFLYFCLIDQENGLVEKCRDFGASWVAVNFAIWLWLFHEGSSIGFGSRKEQLVDKLGDPDSIFEKLRTVIKNLPSFFIPDGFSMDKHAPYMRIINPVNTSTITGESGDNIGRGGRKSQPLTSKILTPIGWTTMGELKVGDIISSSDGGSQKVTGIFPQGLIDVYEVEFSGGSKTECSLDHLWSVTTRNDRRSNSRNKFLAEKKTVTSLEVIKDNLLVKRKDFQKEYNYQIPLVNPIEFEDSILPLDPYLLGALLGDGSFSNMKKTSVTFTTADEEMISLINFSLSSKSDSNGYRLKPSGGYSYRITNIAEKQRTKKSSFKNAILNLGLSGTKSNDKFIPDIYKYSSIENRIEILRGLMDTDGTINTRGRNGCSNKISYSSASKQLCDDLKFIVQSLGGVAWYTTKKTTHQLAHQLVLTMPDGINPFRLKRKASKFSDKQKYKPRLSIIGVKYIGKKECQCISVSSPDRLYITDDLILTHNTVYFKDESAFYERAEKIEAALGDNTNVQIDISSVNGPTTVFQRKREAGEIWESNGESVESGITRVFILDWRDHPFKDQEWYNKRKEKAEREGTLHIFASEVDRDPNSAVEGTLINAEWIKSAIDAHIKLGFDESGMVSSAFDVADEGKDRNAYASKKGIVLTRCEDWRTGENSDVGESTKKVLFYCKRDNSYQLQYDCIGVGSGVKTETNRLIREGVIKNNFSIVPWNAAASPLFPNAHIVKNDRQSPKNKDFYENIKAQGWWELRMRFEKTYKAINNGVDYPEDELISISSKITKVHDLVKELAQPTYTTNSRGKMVINKTPDGSKSPNRADTIMMLYWPIPSRKMIF